MYRTVFVQNQLKWNGSSWHFLGHLVNQSVTNLRMYNKFILITVHLKKVIMHYAKTLRESIFSNEITEEEEANEIQCVYKSTVSVKNWIFPYILSIYRSIFKNRDYNELMTCMRHCFSKFIIFLENYVTNSLVYFHEITDELLPWRRPFHFEYIEESDIPCMTHSNVFWITSTQGVSGT